MVKALYELQRVGGRYALISMCIGGGQGIAAIIENSASTWVAKPEVHAEVRVTS
jgi:hypothetical protein